MKKDFEYVLRERASQGHAAHVANAVTDREDGQDKRTKS